VVRGPSTPFCRDSTNDFAVARRSHVNIEEAVIERVCLQPAGLRDRPRTLNQASFPIASTSRPLAPLSHSARRDFR
jgi:hypothetical protein